MPFHQRDQISYFTFDIFSQLNIDHAIFTRRGGVSPSPWQELNVGSTLGDNQDNVDENRKRSFAAVARPIDSMFDSWLVHGAQVLIADQPAPPSIERPRKGDIILTDKPEVTLFMRYADCVPILLHDPIRRVVGLAHAGWKGTLRRVAAKAVESMVEHFGSNRAQILAAIGPSIAPHHYEVGSDVIELTKQAFGGDYSKFLPKFNGSTHFDLWSTNQAILKQAGVHQIDNPEICTACHLEDWYSHRAENGSTGRFGALIALRSE